MSVEIFLLVVYIGLFIASYWLFSRLFYRVVDPSGEYTLNHDVPLPTPVRAIIVVIALIFPAFIYTFIDAVARFIL